MDYDKAILLIPLSDVQTPALFSSIKQTKIYSTAPRWFKQFYIVIENFEDTGQKSPSIKVDLVKEFIWTIEQRQITEFQNSSMILSREFISAIRAHENRNQMLIELRATESAAMLKQNQKLKLEMSRLLSSNHSQEAILRENMEAKQNIHELTVQLEVLQSKLMEFMLHGPPEAKQKTYVGDDKQEVLYKIFNDLDKRQSSDMRTKPPKMSSQILEFCRRYQGIIAPGQILTLGRCLQLDHVRLDAVAAYEKYGTAEMFWQLIYQYHSACGGDTNMRKLLDCLVEIGIDLQGKPMPSVQFEILEKNMQYLNDNIHDITVINLCLMNQQAMTFTANQYILHATSRVSKLLRLVDYLRTRENGFNQFLVALESTAEGHIARKLKEDLGNSMSCNRNSIENSGLKIHSYSIDDRSTFSLTSTPTRKETAV